MTKQQRGYIFRKGKFWFLRYADTVLRDGKSVRVQLCKKLAPYSDAYRTEKAVRNMADEYFASDQCRYSRRASTMRVLDFIEAVFSPDQSPRRPSTLKNYTDIFRIHLKPRLGEISLRQFRCCDGERLLGEIARQAKTKDGKLLGHKHYQAHQVFSVWHIQNREAHRRYRWRQPYDRRFPARRNCARCNPRLHPSRVRAMLAVLPEPAKTIVLFAAFTGLRQGEIRGVQWRDFTGKTLTVERSIWNGIVNKPKTVCSAAPIAIVRPLADALETHRLRMGNSRPPTSPSSRAVSARG